NHVRAIHPGMPSQSGGAERSFASGKQTRVSKISNRNGMKSLLSPSAHRHQGKSALFYRRKVTRHRPIPPPPLLGGGTLCTRRAPRDRPLTRSVTATLANCTTTNCCYLRCENSSFCCCAAQRQPDILLLSTGWIS